jgi:hypothetical protein
LFRKKCFKRICKVFGDWLCMHRLNLSSLTVPYFLMTCKKHISFCFDFVFFSSWIYLGSFARVVER